MNITFKKIHQNKKYQCLIRIFDVSMRYLSNLSIEFLTISMNSVTYPEIWRSPYGDAASHYGHAASP
jgi:hypothetical protein